MKTSPFGWGLVFCLMLVGLGSLLSCRGVTMAHLQAKNQKAATLEVPCRPSQFPDDVNLWATQVSSGHVVTDERADELLSYAEVADVFIQYNASAPGENARIMRLKYGLACPSEMETQSESSEMLRDEEPCSTQATAPANREFVGDTNPQPCNPGTGGPTNAAAGSAPAKIPTIKVCARPKGIKSDKWRGGEEIKGVSTTTSAAEYEKKGEKATFEFEFDANAPPESVWNFGANTKVRCPGKAPIPYQQWIAKNAGSGTQQAGSGTSGTGTAGTNTTAVPKTGSGPPSATSSPNGKGPPLTTWEDLLRQLSLAGSLASGDASGKTDHVDGNRYGATTGQNAGGFSFPPLQAGYALLQIMSATGTSAKSFVDDIIQNAKRGQRTFIKEADEKMLKVADELINNHGRYEMAHGLQEMGTIMPYKLGSKFTEQLGGKFQAHKILEKRAFERFEIPGLDKAPCVILTDAEHKVITEKLRVAWVGKEGSMTLPELRKIYQDVYRQHPHWLEAIDSYFH